MKVAVNQRKTEMARCTKHMSTVSVGKWFESGGPQNSITSHCHRTFGAVLEQNSESICSLSMKSDYSNRQPEAKIVCRYC